MTKHLGTNPRSRKPAAAPVPLKPKASKLKGGLTFGVVMAAIAAADAVSAGKAGDDALTRASRALQLSPRELSRAASFLDEIFRHWARLGWLWRGKGIAAGRERVLLALRTIGGSEPSEIAALFRRREGVEPLTPADANAIAACPNIGLSATKFPQNVAWELPNHFVQPLRRALGETFDAEIALMQEPARQCLRVNTLRASRERVQEKLIVQGIASEPGTLVPTALWLPAGLTTETNGLALEGWAEPQDEASQAVAALTDARPGMQVLDVCAGAGGKTLALAAAMRNKGHLVATDTHAGRLARAKQRLKRNGVENAECLVPDSKWYKTKRGRFDRVLIDAPCTGSGAWAHNPDQRWRLDEEALARLVGEQDALLDKSAPMVRPGGRLIYATCSFLLEENEDRVAAFLARNAEFRLEPAADVWAEAGLPSWPCHDRNIVRLSPYRHGTSGFFAAVMVRRPLAIRPE